VQLIGEFLKEHNAGNCLWLLDSPVSNSGRLKTLIGELAQKNGWNGFDKLTTGWEIRLSINPDAELIKTDLTAASSDSVVLDGCKRWVNLARAIIEEKVPEAQLVDLS